MPAEPQPLVTADRPMLAASDIHRHFEGLHAVDGVSIDASRFNSDLHASAEYRGNLVRVMAKRAVRALLA